MDDIIISAIQEKKIIELNYHGLHRIVEPHVYGIFNGRECLFVYILLVGDSITIFYHHYRLSFPCFLKN